VVLACRTSTGMAGSRIVQTRSQKAITQRLADQIINLKQIAVVEQPIGQCPD
jgi:hypothetical protein